MCGYLTPGHELKINQCRIVIYISFSSTLLLYEHKEEARELGVSPELQPCFQGCRDESTGFCILQVPPL